MDSYEEIDSRKSDEEVLAASVRDPEQFRILVRRYQDAFVRKADAVVRNREDAEDIVQEAFAKMYLNAERFKKVEGATFKSWAYRIVLNTAFTLYQKKKRERTKIAPLSPELYETLRDSHNEFEKQEVSEYLISVLSKMPEHMERVLKLHFLLGLSQKEVAEVEGTSVGAIKTRIHRAKKEFKKVSSSV